MLPLWDAEPHRRTPVATTLLIAANLAVFAYEVTLAMDSPRAIYGFIQSRALISSALVQTLSDLFARGAIGPHGEATLLTVLTSMFLHGGIAHVVGNCWFLWVFGRNVEGRMGFWKFLIFYLLCGLAAAAAQVAISPHETGPMLGASGAISGVLGAYLVLYPLNWIYTLVPWFVPIIPIPALVFLVVWFGFQAIAGAGLLLNAEDLPAGVAWWAHIGGFVAGLALTLFAKKMRWLRSR
ncbi:MAG TPA: rhomboid family intramembrane serine protease [Opitutaceae bacterium]